MKKAENVVNSHVPRLPCERNTFHTEIFAHNAVFWHCLPHKVSSFFHQRYTGKSGVSLHGCSLKKLFLKAYTKCTGELHPYKRVISINLLGSFIETAHLRGYSPMNLPDLVKE